MTLSIGLVLTGGALAANAGGDVGAKSYAQESVRIEAEHGSWPYPVTSSLILHTQLRELSVAEEPGRNVAIAPPSAVLTAHS
jgi:hypothetical protein